MAALRTGMLQGAWSARQYLRWLAIGWGLGLPAFAALAWWQWASGFDLLTVATASLPLAALARPAMKIGRAHV